MEIVRVKVPAGYKIKVMDKDNFPYKAEEGEIVEMSPESVRLDPYLATHVVGIDKPAKADFYSSATTESLQEALKEKGVPLDKETRPELIKLAKENGVLMTDLKIVEAPKAPAKK